MKIIRSFLLSLCFLALASCATYTTPGRPADLGTFTDPKVKKTYVARPAIRFPANVAVVRVQESGYRSANERGYGQGSYSVVTQRSVERSGDMDRLIKLPGLQGVVALNRLLLPQQLTSDADLREAAAKLQADAILVYTISTEFRSDNVLPPLSIVSLGILNAQRHEVSSSASAVLMDVRTGYIYGALEEMEDKVSGSFFFEGTDQPRQNAERAAFEKLLTSFDPFWRGVYSRYR